MKAEQKHDPIKKVIWSNETDDSFFIKMKAQNEKKGFLIAISTCSNRMKGSVFVRVWDGKDSERTWYECDRSLYVPFKVLQCVALSRLNELRNQLFKRGFHKRKG